MHACMVKRDPGGKGQAGGIYSAFFGGVCDNPFTICPCVESRDKKTKYIYICISLHEYLNQSISLAVYDLFSPNLIYWFSIAA